MRAALGVVSALILSFSPALAQQGDAFVLPRGMARLRAAGMYMHVGSLFRSGGTAPLGSDFGGSLTASRFAPLVPLESGLSGFFGATAGQTGAQPVTVGPGTLTAGELDLLLTANTREVPLSIGLGVAPRVEVMVTVPLLREERIAQRFALSGGTVGRNPDPEANAGLLARIGEQWRDLGALPLLPTASSALGQELQRRVRAATGRELRLPSTPADTAVFNQLLRTSFGAAPLGGGVDAWRAGDVEVAARIQLLNTLGSRALPADSAPRHFRAALGVAARLPTGSAGDTLRLLSLLPETGLAGITVGVDADVFSGRLWAAASARVAALQETDVLRRAVPADAPLAAPARPSALRFSPGAQMELRLSPRFRLTDAIALGAEYALLRQNDSSLGPADGAALIAPGRTLQTLGGGVRYSTLDAVDAGIPLEVLLAYRAAVAGGNGAPAGGTVVIQASLFRRVWGQP